MPDVQPSGQPGTPPPPPPADTAATVPPPPPASGDKPGDASILAADTTVTDTTKVTVPADFPADWQAKMSGGNEEMGKLLKRYGSPADVAAALAAAQQKIRSSKTVEPLGDKPTPEQVAEYRKATGVPEKADGYAVPEGIVPDANTKEMLKGFFEEMHEAHVPKDIVEKAVGAYFKNVEAEQARVAEEDQTFHQTSNMTIRKEWGAHYNTNLNAIKGMLAVMPKEVQDNIMSARLGNGRKLADDPATLREFLRMAKDINPAATVIPGGLEAGKGIDSRKAELDKMMKEKGQNWWHHKEQSGLRQEHLDLITAQEHQKRQQASK